MMVRMFDENGFAFEHLGLVERGDDPGELGEI